MTMNDSQVEAPAYTPEQAVELVRLFAAGHYGYGPKGSAAEFERAYSLPPQALAAALNHAVRTALSALAAGKQEVSEALQLDTLERQQFWTLGWNDCAAAVERTLGHSVVDKVRIDASPSPLSVDPDQKGA